METGEICVSAGSGPLTTGLAAMGIENEAVRQLNGVFARNFICMPLKVVDEKLQVAVADSDDYETLEAVKSYTGKDVIAVTVPAAEILTAIDTFYGDLEYNDAEAGRLEDIRPTHKTLAVISNKGGVGKTHVSINLSCALSKLGKHILLIDGDLANADVSSKLGIFPSCSLQHFFSHAKKIEEIIYQTAYGFELIGGVAGEYKLANLNYTQRHKFIKHFLATSKYYDMTIFDLGAGISYAVLDFALAMDEIIIVTTPQDIISGYACVKAAFQRFMEIENKLRRNKKYEAKDCFAPYIAVNQTRNPRQGRMVFENIVKTADENINANETEFVLKPNYIGSLPYESEVINRAELKKRPLFTEFSHSGFSRSIESLAKVLLDPSTGPEEETESAGKLWRISKILGLNFF